MYKFSKKKIYQPRQNSRRQNGGQKQALQGRPKILGVEPGNCAALGYETNVNYRLQNNCSFKVALDSCLRERIPLRLAYEANINGNGNNKMMQRQLNGEPTINYTHIRLKMSLQRNVSISASGWPWNITQILQFAVEVLSKGDGMLTERTQRRGTSQGRRSYVHHLSNYTMYRVSFEPKERGRYSS